jgi:hypothetical protein
MHEKPVLSAFRNLAFRTALQIPPVARLYESRDALLSERDNLLESVRRISKERDDLLAGVERPNESQRDSPFYHYHSPFKLEDIILEGMRPLKLLPERDYWLTSSTSSLIPGSFLKC